MNRSQIKIQWKSSISSTPVQSQANLASYLSKKLANRMVLHEAFFFFFPQGSLLCTVQQKIQLNYTFQSGCTHSYNLHLLWSLPSFGYIPYVCEHPVRDVFLSGKYRQDHLSFLTKRLAPASRWYWGLTLAKNGIPLHWAVPADGGQCTHVVWAALQYASSTTVLPLQAEIVTFACVIRREQGEGNQT